MRDNVHNLIREESDGYSSDNSDFSMGETEGNHEPDFGILFDVDGVLARGSTPLESAKRAMQKLKDANGHLKVPCTFVTNACNRSYDKARQIGNWFDIEVSPDQVIHAPTPAKLLRDLHDKHTLVIGQEHRLDIAADLGFTKLCTLDDVKAAYPLLDMVDHENRVVVARGKYQENPNFPRVGAVLLIGEPTHWESNLQLLIDLLLTEGKPTQAPTDLHSVPQIPVIACNMDLVFMAEACMPRFGHGAFLLCLEALYSKLTGHDLHYTSLIGKPCEITYRFAEHTVANIAKRMGITKPLKRLYFFGDNPHVDIVGANLYDRFIKQQSAHSNNNNGNDMENNSSNNSDDASSTTSTDSTTFPTLPSSRVIPTMVPLNEQTVEHCLSLLVGTGVYKHGTEVNRKGADGKFIYHGHRDIAHEPQLTKPHKYVPNVEEGIDYIFARESASLSS
ncbi:hypothetical protein ACOMHN_026099 [Nucella lapillus]